MPTRKPAPTLRRAALWGALAALVPSLLMLGAAAGPAAAAGAQVRITEWMYQGAGAGDVGEFVEITNVGDAPASLAGWSYHDSGRTPGAFSLTVGGTLAPGESLVLTEVNAQVFRTNWGRCASARILGGLSPNLGRGDEINIYDGSNALVDRLTYADNGSAGGPRTQTSSARAPQAALGANNAPAWALSSVGDVEGSWASGLGEIGSPGITAHGGYDPCAPAEPEPEGPTLTIDEPVVGGRPGAVGAVGDPTNPAVAVLVADDDTPVEDLTLTAVSGDQAVVPNANITVEGTGARRTVRLAPVARGTAAITLTVTDPDDASSTATLDYYVSGPAADPSGRYHGWISDASAAIDVGDGYMLLANDETQTLFLHKQDESGPPVRAWTFGSSEQVGEDEIDLEAAARVGDRIVWLTSHGNGRDGSVKERRRVAFTTTVTGHGADTELTFLGRYGKATGNKQDIANTNIRHELAQWDAGNGHGLGANALRFVAG